MIDEVLECFQEFVGVVWVEVDGWFVEYVEEVGEVCVELCG